LWILLTPLKNSNILWGVSQARRRKQLSLERNTMPGQALLVKLGKGLQRSSGLWYTLLWALFLFVSIAPVPGVAADLRSYAIIRDDATLKIER
jgi:hypothetical protein